jgi:hypothetical protein
MRLILSAEPSVEALLRGPLSQAGFQLDIVQSVDAIIALAGLSPPPDAVLASAPTAAEGTALFWELKARLGASAVPLVLIVMAGADADAERLTKAGAAGVFLAPVNGGRLLKRLKELAGAAKAAAPLAKPAAPVQAGAAHPATPPTPAVPVPASAVPNPFVAVAQAARPLPSPAELASAMEADRRAAPARNEQLEAMLGMDVDLRSLPGRHIDLGNLMTSEAPPKTAAPSIEEVPISLESIAPPPSVDLTGPVRWPANLPPVEAGVAVLVARTLGAPLVGGVDEATVAETWKALTNASLTRIAAERLRIRTALMQAERLIAAGAVVDIDDAFVASCQQDIKAVVKDSLDPILQWAVAQGQLELMKQFRSVRESLLQRGQDLERAAGRLRGLVEEHVVRARLDTSIAPPEGKKPLSGRFKTRLLEISTVTAQSVRDNGPMLIRVAIVLAVVSAGLHLFVFDSFGLRHGPQKVDKSVPILGVQKIELFEGMETATVNSAFDMSAGLKELARTAQPGTTLLIVDADTLRPIKTVGRDRLQEVANMQVEGLADNDMAAKPGTAAPTAPPQAAPTVAAAVSNTAARAAAATPTPAAAPAGK